LPLVNYLYPRSRTLRRINPEKIVDLQRPRPTFTLFPVVDDINAWRIEWEQKDNYRGFQQLRGLNGEPSYVTMQGAKRFSAEPTVFGEYMTVDEMMMTTRAAMSNPAALGEIIEDVSRPVDIRDLVIERQEYLNVRETDLLEYIHWAVLLNGTITIAGPTGAEYKATFPIQTADFSDWTDHENSTPYADLVGLSLLARGKSVTFRGGQAFGNAITINHALQNTNPVDLGGMRVSGQLSIRLGTPMNLPEVNQILTTGGAPTLVEYDEGYNRESDGALINWIPDLVLSIVGRRTNNDTLGQYRMVRNVNNPGVAAGRYTKVIDNLDRDIPRRISVHQGHNGGLAIYYASAFVRAAAGP
jgi:hypothetical protein